MADNYDIGPKIGIEGEAQYRQSISDVNRDLKLLTSELKLTATQFDGNANSMEALRAKGDLLSKQYDTQKSKIDIMRGALANAAAEYGTNDKRTQQWQISLNNAEGELIKIDRSIQDNAKYLKEATTSANGHATSIDGLGKKTKEAGNNSEEFGKKSKVAIDAMAAALLAAGVQRTLREITEALTACVEAANEFESAFAGVEKTVDGTDAELQAISDDIKAMSLVIPATTTEIAGVAEAAGQLGIKTKDITAFSEVMINLGVATNLTSNEAASMFAKFANITKLDSSKYENLGSVVVDLGNNFATTENDIVSMSMRMAAGATIAGLSQAQIMALAASVSSLGIEAEAGGSSMSKLLSELQLAVETGKGLEEFAKVAGLSAEQFSTAWGQDAAGALNLFIQGLNDTRRNGASATAVLDELGITEIRMRNAVLALANSGDLLTRALGTANKAWDENNALQIEADKRYETTESKLQMLKNSYTLVRIAVGDALTPAIREFADAGTESLEWVAEFIEKNPEMVQVITALTIGIGVFVGGVVVATVAVKAFNAAIAANPVGLLVMGLTAVVVAIASFIVMNQQAAAASEELNDASKELNTTIIEGQKARLESKKSIEAEAAAAQFLADKLYILDDKEHKSNEEKAQMAALVEELNKAIPGLSLAINMETGELNKQRGAVDELITSNLKLAKVKAAQDDLILIAKDQYEAERMLADLEEQRISLADTLAQKTEELKDITLINSAAGNEASMVYTETAKQLKVTTDQIEATQKNIRALGDEWNSTSDYIGDNSDYVAGGNAADTLGGKVEELSGKLANAYEEAHAAAKESIDGQIALFEDMSTKATESFEIQFGLFDTLSSKSDKTMAGLTASLTSQMKFMDEYATNMQTAMARGVDEGLLKKLSDGSVESAQILATLAEATDAEIATMNASLAGVEEGKDKLTGLFTDMADEGGQAIKDLVDDLKSQITYMDEYADNLKSAMDRGVDEGLIQTLSDGSVESAKILADIRDGSYEDILALNANLALVEDGKKEFVDILTEAATEADTAGYNAGAGFSNGLNRSEVLIKKAAKQAANAAINTFNNTLEIMSPSRKFRWSAEMSSKGYTEEMERQIANMEKVMSSAGDRTHRSFNAASLNREAEAPRAGQNWLGIPQPPIIVQAVMDGKKVGYGVSDNVSATQAWRFRRANA